MKNNFMVTAGIVLAFGLSTSVLAQDFCNATHSGSKAEVSNEAPTGDSNGKGSIDQIGDYSYEEWNKSGTGKATFYSDGSFYCEFTNVDDYLCRSGILYGKNSGVNYKDVGHLYADVSLKKFTNQSGVSYAYVGVYGWTQDPLIEWYIVDSWGNGGRPTWCGTLVTTVSIDGAEYDIYKDDITDARGTIEGIKTFTQYWSIRKKARKCGTIDITAHFDAWEAAGLKMGSSLYEAKILGEAGQYPEAQGANGSFDFNYAKVYIGDGSAPASSSSNKVTSSSSVALTGGTPIPGTIELEDFEKQGADEVTVYGDVVGEIAQGAWLEYTVSVERDGIYEFEILAAREDSDGNESGLTLSVDGIDVGSVSVLTDDWDDYREFKGTTTKSLAKGTHTLRVTFDYGYLNVDNIKFTAFGSSSLFAGVRMDRSGRTYQVFDMQGRFMGRVDVANGTKMADALLAKFHKSGTYVVKQGQNISKVTVK